MNLPDLQIPPPAPEFTEAAFDAHADAYLRATMLRQRADYFAHNCPPAYRDFNADHPSIQANRAQIDRILAWQATSAKGLLATGPSNRGKTRAVFALCRRLLCVEGVDVGIWRAKDFFSALQAEVRFGRDDALDFVKRVAARRVLFIDDFGQEAVQSNREEWAMGWFFDLLDRRIGSGLPLLVTTNLTARDLAAGSSDMRDNAFVRRLLDLAEPVKFNP